MNDAVKPKTDQPILLFTLPSNHLFLERGTGLEPATICLEGRDSTTELPPLMPANPDNFLEPGTGIEPVTSSLPRTRSTNWATQARTGSRDIPEAHCARSPREFASRIYVALAIRPRSQRPRASHCAKQSRTHQTMVDGGGFEPP